MLRGVIVSSHQFCGCIFLIFKESCPLAGTEGKTGASNYITPCIDLTKPCQTFGTNRALPMAQTYFFLDVAFLFYIYKCLLNFLTGAQGWPLLPLPL
jgi:hypothetical protein